MLQVIESRDALKKSKAKQQGITLIIVPFWWDSSTSRFFIISILYSLMYNFSLMATINLERPDIFNDKVIHGTPIPSHVPQDSFKAPEWIEGVGEPVNACLLTDS